MKSWQSQWTHLRVAFHFNLRCGKDGWRGKGSRHRGKMMQQWASHCSWNPVFGMGPRNNTKKRSSSGITLRVYYLVLITRRLDGGGLVVKLGRKGDYVINARPRMPWRHADRLSPSLYTADGLHTPSSLSTTPSARRPVRTTRKRKQTRPLERCAHVHARARAR